jgi:hypothetical protein
MEHIHLQEGKIMVTSLNDGTRGRFDFRGTDSNNYTLYMSFSDNSGLFYKEKIQGDLNTINLRLERFEIVAEIWKGEYRTFLPKRRGA